MFGYRKMLQIILTFISIIIHFSVNVNDWAEQFCKIIVKVVLNISERKNPLTPYGICVNVRLMEQCKTQTWLIEQLRVKLPERYFDSSILNKILTGQVNSPKTVVAINEILGIEESETKEPYSKLRR